MGVARDQHRIIIDELVSVNHASSLSLQTADATVNVGGAQVGDVVVLGLPAVPQAGFLYNAFVSAANVVTIRGVNVSSGTIDPPAVTMRVQILRLY